MKVVTIELNPSLDRTVVTHNLNLGYHNRTTETTRLDPAGRGVNISRALHRMGGRTIAVVLLGNDATGRAYRALVSEEGFPVRFISKTGLTRSNITLVDTGHKQETRIIEDGEGGLEEDFHAVVQVLKDLIEPGDLVVPAGSLPQGVDINWFERLTHEARAAGATIILAARYHEVTQQTLQASPDAVVLNRNQAERLFNYPVRILPDVIYCANKLREEHGIGQVLTTMFGDGVPPAAVLVTGENIWVVDADEVETDEGTRDGIGDALIAGFLTAWTKQYPSKKALELGAASAIYTATQLGNAFGTLDDIGVYLNREACVVSVHA